MSRPWSVVGGVAALGAAVAVAGPALSITPPSSTDLGGPVRLVDGADPGGPDPAGSTPAGPPSARAVPSVPARPPATASPSAVPVPERPSTAPRVHAPTRPAPAPRVRREAPVAEVVPAPPRRVAPPSGDDSPDSPDEDDGDDGDDD